MLEQASKNEGAQGLPHAAAGTVRVGLVGGGIQRSRTPRMHEAEAHAQGIALRYDLLDTDAGHSDQSLAQLIATTEREGFAGLNITYPHKIAVIKHLDTLSEAARNLGAVNTVVFRDGKRHGHNTDMWGFAESFRRTMAGAARARVLLIGAGGAGVAVAHALLDCGVATLLVADTDPARVTALVARLDALHPGRATAAAADTALRQGVDGVVNATPVGMAKCPGTPCDTSLLTPATWVADIVYFPLETELLAAARACGCARLPGAGMAVFQAVRAFELFTGRRADPARMLDTFNSFTS